MRVIIDQGNYVPDQGIVLDTEDIVDRDGYRSTEEIVMEMVFAGQRLQEFRREEFDTVDEDIKDLHFNDPTKDHGYDVIDGAADMSKLETLYKKEIAIQEEKKKLKEEEEKKKTEVT